MWMNNENRAFIPLWFLRNKDVEGKYKEGTDVSIPLWFSRNDLKALKEKAAAMGFHTTMVLTQRVHFAEKNEQGVMFPYHYGSHATSFIKVILSRFKVSIPLWFSRNKISIKEKAVKIGVSIPLWFSLNRFHYKIIIYDYGN